MKLVPNMHINCTNYQASIVSAIVVECGIKTDVAKNVTNVSIGHHLHSVLEIMRRQKMKEMFVMVLVEVRSSEFRLDLPGGKRRLGEDTFKCAIRETEEESSLDVNSLQYEKNEYTDQANSYFFINTN